MTETTLPAPTIGVAIAVSILFFLKTGLDENKVAWRVLNYIVAFFWSATLGRFVIEQVSG